MKRIIIGLLAALASTSASATIIGSSLSKGEDGTPLINTGVLDQLSGIKPTFPSVSAFNAAVAQERTNITNNGVGVWPSGQELGIIGQLGVRQWFVGSSAAASNAWNVLYLGKVYTLAADSNVFVATSGPPSNSTGNNGDYAADGVAGLVYGPKASGAWPAGVSATTVPLGGLTGLGTGVGTALSNPLNAASGLVTFSGAFGTPSALTLTNATGLPLAGLAQSGATTNQVIQWNGTAWVPAAASGGITGPGTTVSGYVPAWNGTTGSALAAGLPVGLTGNSTIVETTSGGLLTPSLLPIATTGALGGIKPDGTTITVNSSTGVASAVGGSATSIIVGTTTIGGGTAPCLLENSTGTTMACAGLGSGVATALGVNLNGTGALAATTSPTFVTPTLGAASATSVNATGGTPYSVTGTEVLNLIANQTSPIIDNEGIISNPASTYMPGALNNGFNITVGQYLDTASTGGYDTMATGNYTVNGTQALHVGMLKTAMVLVAGSGTPFINGEVNQEKSQVQVPTNVTVATGENKELNLSVGGGTVTKWFGETLYPVNAGTIGTYFGAYYTPTNSNTAAGAWTASYGFACAGFVGAGGPPATNVCFHNLDYTAENLNYGHSNTRPYSGHNPTVSANCSIDTIGSTEGGNDESGLLTITGTSTSCTVTFAVAYGNATHCSLSSPDGSQYISYTQAPTTALTVNYVSASTGHFIYHCMGGT